MSMEERRAALFVAAEALTVAALRDNLRATQKFLAEAGSRPFTIGQLRRVSERGDGEYQLLQLNVERLFVLIAAALELSPTNRPRNSGGRGAERGSIAAPPSLLTGTCAPRFSKRASEHVERCRGLPFELLLPPCPQRCPTLRNYIGLQRRVTSVIAAAVATRAVVSVSDLERELCTLEGVSAYWELQLGINAANLCVVRRIFRLDELHVVHEVSAQDFVSYCASDAHAQGIIASGGDAGMLIDAFTNSRLSRSNGRLSGIHVEDFAMVLALLHQQQQKQRAVEGAAAGGCVRVQGGGGLRDAASQSDPLVPLGPAAAAPMPEAATTIATSPKESHPQLLWGYQDTPPTVSNAISIAGRHPATTSSSAIRAVVDHSRQHVSIASMPLPTRCMGDAPSTQDFAALVANWESQLFEAFGAADDDEPLAQQRILDDLQAAFTVATSRQPPGTRGRGGGATRSEVVTAFATAVEAFTCAPSYDEAAAVTGGSGAGAAVGWWIPDRAALDAREQLASFLCAFANLAEVIDLAFVGGDPVRPRTHAATALVVWLRSTPFLPCESERACRSASPNWDPAMLLLKDLRGLAALLQWATTLPEAEAALPWWVRRGAVSSSGRGMCGAAALTCAISRLVAAPAAAPIPLPEVSCAFHRAIRAMQTLREIRDSAISLFSSFAMGSDGNFAAQAALSLPMWVQQLRGVLQQGRGTCDFPVAFGIAPAAAQRAAFQVLLASVNSILSSAEAAHDPEAMMQRCESWIRGNIASPLRTTPLLFVPAVAPVASAPGAYLRTVTTDEHHNHDKTPVLGFFVESVALSWSVPRAMLQSQARPPQHDAPSPVAMCFAAQRLTFAACHLPAFSESRSGDNHGDESDSTAFPDMQSFCCDVDIGLALPVHPNLAVWRTHMRVLRSIMILSPTSTAAAANALVASSLWRANNTTVHYEQLVPAQCSIVELGHLAAAVHDVVRDALLVCSYFAAQSPGGAGVSATELATEPLFCIIGQDSARGSVGSSEQRWRAPSEGIWLLYGTVGAKLAAIIAVPDRVRCSERQRQVRGAPLAASSEFLTRGDIKASVLPRTVASDAESTNSKSSSGSGSGTRRRRRFRHPSVAVTHSSPPLAILMRVIPPRHIIDFLVDTFNIADAISDVGNKNIALGRVVPLISTANGKVFVNLAAVLPFVQAMLVGEEVGSEGAPGTENVTTTPMRPPLDSSEANRVADALEKLRVVVCDWFEVTWHLTPRQCCGADGAASCTCFELRAEKRSEYMEGHGLLAIQQEELEATQARCPTGLATTIARILVPETAAALHEADCCATAEARERVVSLLLETLGCASAAAAVATCRQRALRAFGEGRHTKNESQSSLSPSSTPLSSCRPWRLQLCVGAPPVRFRNDFIPGTRFIDVGVPSPRACDDATNGSDDPLKWETLPLKRMRGENASMHQHQHHHHSRMGGSGTGSGGIVTTHHDSLDKGDGPSHPSVPLADELFEQQQQQHEEAGGDNAGAGSHISLAHIYAKQELTRAESDAVLLSSARRGATVVSTGGARQDLAAGSPAYSRRAEHFVLHVVSAELGPGQRAVWVNERAESGLPYDVVIKDARGEDVHYIEVKSTTTRDRRVFELSVPELLFAATKRDRFSIFRVFNSTHLGEDGQSTVTLGGKASVSVQRVHDVLSLLERREVALTGDLRVVMVAADR